MSSSFQNVAPQPVEPGANISDVLPPPSETLTQHAASASPVIGDYKLPETGLLNGPTESTEQDDEELRAQAVRLAEMFAALKVYGQIDYINPGFSLHPKLEVLCVKVTIEALHVAA